MNYDGIQIETFSAASGAASSRGIVAFFPHVLCDRHN
jgi:hypothetical protein